MSFLRGCLAILFIVLNMTFFGPIILLAASIAKILPKKAYPYGMRFALQLPVYWMVVNKWILKMNTYGKWEIKGSGDLNLKSWYLVIANHESWTDILVLGGLFSRKIPLLKFFMKKELLWQLPLAGIDAYLLGYPILARHTRNDIRKNPKLKGKDIEATKQACQKFKEFPTTFMNFVEGTRFTEKKRIGQNSPYQYLLKPKAAGTAIVITEMADKLKGIINVTIHYDAEHKSLWNVLCGKINKIYVYYELIPMSDDLTGNYYEDREYRKNFQQWINGIWEEKDKMIHTFKNKNT